MKFKFTRTLSSQQKILLIFVVLPLYLICGSLIGNAIVNYLINIGMIANDYYTMLGALNLIVDLIEVIVVVLIFKEDLIIQFKDFKKNYKGHLKYGLFIGVGLIWLMALIGSLATLLLGGAEQSQNQTMIESVMGAQPLLMAIPAVLLAPVAEEIVFRGMLYAWVREKFPKLAHFISAFLFGFAHVVMGLLAGNSAEFVQIIPYFLMGMALSYLYEKRNNIYVPIISHIINNFIAIIVTSM